MKAYWVKIKEFFAGLPMWVNAVIGLVIGVIIGLVLS